MDKGWAAERDELAKACRANGEEDLAKFLEEMKPPSEFDRVVGELCKAGLPRTAEWLRKQNLARDHSPEYAHWLTSRAKASAKAFEEMVEEVKKAAEVPKDEPESLRMVFLPEHGEILQSILAAVKKQTLDLDRALKMLKWIELEEEEEGARPSKSS